MSSVGGPKAMSLTDADATELAVLTASTFQTNRRRVRQWHRWLMLEEDFVGLLEAEIDHQFQDPTIRERLKKLVSITRNVVLDVLRKVCVVYNNGVTRRIDGATDDQQDAIAELAMESGIDEDAVDWHRYAYGIGPCQVIPQITDGELDFDFLVPHVYEMIPHPNPRKGVLAAAWEWLNPVDGANTVVLDGEAWRYYQIDGAGSSARLPEPVDVVPHGLGIFPGATFRFTRNYGTDWWCTSRLERVYRGTIEVAVMNTILQIVRRSQNRKLLTLVGKTDSLAHGAVLDTEVAVLAEGDPDELEIEVHDFDVDPKNFINLINWLEAGIIESFGIPAHAVTFDSTSGTEGERILFTQQGLTEIRKQQLPKIRRFERELWYRAIKICKLHGHPLASRLPDPEDVRRGLRLDVPPLAHAFTDPAVEQAWWEGQIRNGQATYEDWLMSANPGMNRTDARKRIGANLDSIGMVREVMAERIFKLDLQKAADEAASLEAKPGDGIAEALGRQGGKASGVARSSDSKDDDAAAPEE